MYRWAVTEEQNTAVVMIIEIHGGNRIDLACQSCMEARVRSLKILVMGTETVMSA